MNLQEWSSFLGTTTVVHVLEIQHIFSLNIFAVLKMFFLTAVALWFILWLSTENCLCAHVINEQYPLAIWDWDCWCFQICPFFSGGVTVVREKSFSRLSPRESTGAEESVGSTKTLANLWKKGQALTFDQTGEARNITLIPFINIHFCLSHFQLLLLYGWYLYSLFYHFRPYYIYNFNVYLCSPSSITESFSHSLFLCFCCCFSQVIGVRWG